MKEQMKTLALTALVTISLLLSLGIWSITPQYEQMDAPQFDNNVSPVNPGLQRTLRAVTEPREVILHVGEGKHTAAFPGQSLYRQALELLREASFFDLKITSEFTEEEWERIVKQGSSLQFEFDTRLSGQVLDDADLLQFTSRIEPSMQCKTLYLYKTTEDSDLRAVFYDEKEDRTYVARAVLPKEQYTVMLNLARQEQKERPYELHGELHRNFALPAGKSVLNLYSFDAVPRTEEEIEQLVDAFFFDKSLTRRVDERDGSQIFTDGSRLVRVSQKERVIEYRNIGLAASVHTPVEPDVGPAKVLAFTNDHGGFHGDVLLHERPEERSNLGRPENEPPQRRFSFRQYYDGIPLIGDLTSVHAGLTGNEVTMLQRSRYTLSPRPFQTSPQEIVSGAEVLAAVERIPLLRRNKISSVYLAYLVEEPMDKIVNLRPVWVVLQASDNQSGLVDALTGEPLRTEEGALRGLE